MDIISIEQARLQCRLSEADGEDDTLTLYGDAAERACMRHANRNFYPTAAALDTAVAALSTMIAGARSTYDTAMDAAAALTDTRARTSAEKIAEHNLFAAELEFDRTLNGLVVDANNNQDVILAILQTLGSFYRNRESTVTGQGAAAVVLPNAATAVLERIYRVPDL